MWNFRLSQLCFRRINFFVVWRCVFGWVLSDVSIYPCTFMLVLNELKNNLTVWTLKMKVLRSFERWGTTHWTKVRHIQKDLKFQQPCVWENLWYYGRLSVVAVQISSATDRSVCTSCQYIQLSYVFGGCGQPNPTEKEPGDRGKGEVPRPYEHNLAQSYSARGCALVSTKINRPEIF